MMPLTFADVNVDYEIKKISGSAEVRKHLENLGFVVGGMVKPISTVQGNLIVEVKGVRVAIGKDLASKIMV